jgi:hypothetical protein
VVQKASILGNNSGSARSRSVPSDEGVRPLPVGLWVTLLRIA